MRHSTVNHSARVIGLELIVDNLDRSVALFVDIFGFEESTRGKSPLVAGDLAVVTDGRFAISLLCPASHGDGKVLPDRSPRLSQLILTAEPSALDAAREIATEAGLSVATPESGFYLPPEAITGVLGINAAVVATVAQEADS